MAKTILAIDDSTSIRQMVAFTLKSSGYTVIEAADGQEGLDKANANADTITLILTDQNMPRMDGLTLTRRLKADPAYQHIRIVALTSFAMKGDEQKAREAGCDGYITKPIDTRALPGQIAACMDETQPTNPEEPAP